MKGLLQIILRAVSIIIDTVFKVIHLWKRDLDDKNEIENDEGGKENEK